MQTTRKRTPLFMAIAIGAVATMGLGFALWSESLSVAATVNTGELSVAFANANTSDPEECEAAVVNDGDLQITLTNAYPGYSCEITTDIENSGTVDAVVSDFVVDGPVANGKITIASSDPADSYPVGTTAGPTFTVAVDSTATEDDVDEGASYTIGASIEFENDTP